MPKAAKMQAPRWGCGASTISKTDAPMGPPPSAPEAKPLGREEEETRVIPALVAGIQDSTNA